MKLVRGDVYVKMRKNRCLCLVSDPKSLITNVLLDILNINGESVDIPELDKHGKVGSALTIQCKKNEFCFLICQYLSGPPRAYDTEKERLELFKKTFDYLEKITSNKIVVPYYIGSYDKEGWIKRKEIMANFEQRTKKQILIFVSDEDIEKYGKKNPSKN